MMALRRRAARGSGDQLRTDILEVTEELLIHFGNEDAVSIKRVSETVGVTPPSIYLHFKDKEELLLAVSERQFEALAATLDEAAIEASDPLEELWLRGRAYVEYGLVRPESYRIMFMSRPARASDPTLEVMSPAFASAISAVERARLQGLLRDDIDPLLVATTLWCNAHGVTSLLIAKPDFPWPDKEVLITQVLEQSLRGLIVAPG